MVLVFAVSVAPLRVVLYCLDLCGHQPQPLPLTGCGISARELEPCPPADGCNRAGERVRVGGTPRASPISDGDTRRKSLMTETVTFDIYEDVRNVGRKSYEIKLCLGCWSRTHP